MGLRRSIAAVPGARTAWATLKPTRETLRVWRHHRTADVSLISYPKSGRTWLRMMLGRAFEERFDVDDVGDPTNLYAVTRRLPAAPTIDVHHDDIPHWKPADQVVVDKSRYADKRVLLLVRDPRDVVVSEYFHKTRRLRLIDMSLDEFLVAAPEGGIDSIVRFYNAWANQLDVPRDFLLVRYEDLHEDPRGQLRQVLNFLEIDASESVVVSAVEASSFERMRKIEETGAIDIERLRPVDPNDSESFKMRRGRVGGFRDYLDSDQIAWLDATLRKSLSPIYGYS